jgi:hypothetical protein
MELWQIRAYAHNCTDHGSPQGGKREQEMCRSESKQAKIDHTQKG